MTYVTLYSPTHIAVVYVVDLHCISSFNVAFVFLDLLYVIVMYIIMYLTV